MLNHHHGLNMLKKNLFVIMITREQHHPQDKKVTHALHHLIICHQRITFIQNSVMETIHFNKHVKVNSIFHFVSLYLPPHIHQCCFVPLFLNHLQARFSYNFIFIFYYFAFFFKYMTCTSILFEGQHRYLFILALRKIKNSFLFNRGLFRKKNKKKSQRIQIDTAAVH